MSQQATKERFTQADAMQLWNEAGGVSQQLESWWGRRKVRERLARTGGFVGSLALTLHEHRPQPYHRYVRSVPEDRLFVYRAAPDVPIESALGAGAIVATAMGREVAVSADADAGIIVRPGEWPQDVIEAYQDSMKSLGQPA